jgi:hypothetical protein
VVCRQLRQHGFGFSVVLGIANLLTSFVMLLMRYAPSLTAFLLVWGVGAQLFAAPIVIDSFVSSPLHIVASASTESSIFEQQTDVPNVAGGIRSLYLGSFKSTSADEAVVRIADGTLSVVSPFANESFWLGYGRDAWNQGDVGLSLLRDERVVIRFDYLRAQ